MGVLRLHPSLWASWPWLLRRNTAPLGARSSLPSPLMELPRPWAEGSGGDV